MLNYPVAAVAADNFGLLFLWIAVSKPAHFGYITDSRFVICRRSFTADIDASVICAI